MIAFLVFAACGKPPTDPSTAPSQGFRLVPVVKGLVQPTDIQFQRGRMVVTNQAGTLSWIDAEGRPHVWRELTVTAGGERGLLGVAFDPDYDTNGRVILSWTETVGEQLTSKIGVWFTRPDSPPGDAPLEPGPVLFQIAQPWGNHNGGGVQFGPDGLLYVGFGDGGKANDPLGAGQDVSTALGAMLRLDPDLPAPHVPADNPFLGDPKAVGAIWAIGLRNPWRFSFTPDGRLIAGDVGQNTWEEITFVPRGGNLGWNVKEGDACFGRDPCTGAFTDPIWTYPRTEGVSVTGGYVATSGPLAGRYVFGDYATGRIWSFVPPDGDQRAKDVIEHGAFDANWSTFGRDEDGRIYAADHRAGTIFRLDPR